ncbi:MAG: glycoside hydrolase family 13 protein [Bacillus subtilis]|nr:glycoside hydrolase family 13 protein [Bacillus subtilis]
MNSAWETYQANQESLFSIREKDWRNGAIVYQALVDRFAPSINLEAKQSLYQPPRTLKRWSETPQPGQLIEAVKYWSHELDFWGGDLTSLTSKLDYLFDLGIDVLYLNPIHLSASNHKYDASDYMQISPEFGTKDDLVRLANLLHAKHRRLMLDGVFNHVGVNAPIHQAAINQDIKYRAWFDFNLRYPEGVRLWADVKSLPELNLELPAVRDYLYRSKDSVIRSYLALGIDGWRLDVAFDIGFRYLAELTENAHQEKPGSMVVGEIWNYPQDWVKAIDGVMNFTLREIILRSIKQAITPAMAAKMIERMILDAGIEAMLKSWNVLDNHDVPRLNHELPAREDQRLAQLLQFTLPGSPNLYYGTELGMAGGADPANRAPMRWDLVSSDNEVYRWTKELIALHQQERALKIGDYRSILAQRLLAFCRSTDKVEDTILVLCNFVGPSRDGRRHDSRIPAHELFEVHPCFRRFDRTDVSRRIDENHLAG